MKTIAFLIGVILFTSTNIFGESAKTYVGVITDSMCARDHAAMKVSPEERCVRECVRDGKTYKYALAHDRGVSLLSDQETPAQLAGATVKVTGVLYPKTNILKVERIERVTGK
jgi:hypothetical protein